MSIRKLFKKSDLDTSFSLFSDTVGAVETGEFRTPVAARQGNERLPSARAVSNAIHTNSDADTKTFTMMVMQWGQFIDHDITSTPQSRGFNDSIIKGLSCVSEPES